VPVKKGRHRRYEEARALKRSNNDDIEGLIDRLDEDPFDLPVTKEAGRLTEVDEAGRLVEADEEYSYDED
jgi:hypothetical protein